MCSSEEEAQPGEETTPPTATEPLAGDERRVLASQLAHFQGDQRDRAAQLASLSGRPALTASQVIAPILSDLNHRQVKIALASQRFDRFVEDGDPRAVAYERALARLLSEQHRELRVLLEAAEREQLPAEDLALIDALVEAWSRSLLAFQVLDDTFDYSVRDASEDWYVEVDVLEELERAPQHEIYFTFATWFEPTEYELYAETYEIELPAAEVMADYADEDSLDDIEVEEIEYVQLEQDELEIAALEAQYGLEAPEYTEELLDEEPDYESEEMEDSFDGQDEQMERIYETDPDELAENDAYEDEAAEEEPVVEEASVEEASVEEASVEEVGVEEDEPSATDEGYEAVELEGE
jgi:hypothetical protein